MTNQQITQAEAAKKLGVHPRTLARWRAAGKLTVQRDEFGRPYYDSLEVTTLVQQMTSERTG